jgi:predicted dinucleotide-binding enzyme
MRIGIIGAGNIGGTLARLLTRAGHEVVVANSRGPKTLAGLVAELGERATAGTVADAAGAGEVVMVAVPFPRYRDLPAAGLAGKIVVDANNDWSGEGGDALSSSEVIAAALTGARVVKAFNTIHYVELDSQGTVAGTPGRRAIPIAGDDPEAKAVVAGLIDDIGFDVYDVGSLAAGRRIEPGSPAFNVGLTREEIAAALA